MKPVKPYKSFPLTPHHRGGWNKKYKGRQLYIPFADPDAALAEFHRRARAIDGGQEPTPAPRAAREDCMRVGEVANRYVLERDKDVKAGTLSRGAMQDYRDASVFMCHSLGALTPVDSLTPEHFTRLYRELQAKNLGAHAMARMIQNMRTIWNHADANDWIDRRPKFGTVFKKPTPGKKNTTPPTPAEVRRLIDAATGQLKAMILLGINCGFLAADCSALPRSAVDLECGIVRFPRVKMKNRRPIDRVATLWPKTVDALRAAMKEARHKDLVFLTSHNRPWVRVVTSKSGKASAIDSVGLMYRRLCRNVKPPVAAERFADLRHVHRTIADELEAPNAAARIMGHRLPGLAEVYVDRIEHDRLQAITDHIRSRVFTGDQKRRERRGRADETPAGRKASPASRKRRSPTDAPASRQAPSAP